MAVALAATALTGCAHIEFGADKGLLYYEPVPYLIVTRGADCTVSATLLMLPGREKHLQLAEGYGSADLKVTLSNGMITEVGQNVDNKVPDTLASLAALRSATFAKQGCAGPPAILYPIEDGLPVWARGEVLGKSQK